MNLEHIPTPETDRSETCVKHAHRILFDDDMVVESYKVRDLERRLTVANGFIMQVRDTSSSSRLQRQSRETLTLTAPKL